MEPDQPSLYLYFVCIIPVIKDTLWVMFSIKSTRLSKWAVTHGNSYQAEVGNDIAGFEHCSLEVDQDVCMFHKPCFGTRMEYKPYPHTYVMYIMFYLYTYILWYIWSMVLSLLSFFQGILWAFIQTLALCAQRGSAFVSSACYRSWRRFCHPPDRSITSHLPKTCRGFHQNFQWEAQHIASAAILWRPKACFGQVCRRCFTEWHRRYTVQNKNWEKVRK